MWENTLFKGFFHTWIAKKIAYGMIELSIIYEEKCYEKIEQTDGIYTVRCHGWNIDACSGLCRGKHDIRINFAGHRRNGW